jgi:hypothetical protein
LPDGKRRQFQVVQGVFFSRAIRDQVSRDFPHAVEVANLALQITKGLGVDLVDILLAPLALGQRKGDNVLRTRRKHRSFDGHGGGLAFYSRRRCQTGSRGVETRQ